MNELPVELQWLWLEDKILGTENRKTKETNHLKFEKNWTNNMKEKSIWMLRSLVMSDILPLVMQPTCVMSQFCTTPQLLFYMFHLNCHLFKCIHRSGGFFFLRIFIRGFIKYIIDKEFVLSLMGNLWGRISVCKGESCMNVTSQILVALTMGGFTKH